MSIFSKIGKAINKGAQGVAKAVTKKTVNKAVSNSNTSVTSSQVMGALDRAGVNQVYDKFGKDTTNLVAATAISLGTLGIGTALSGGLGAAQAANAIKTAKTFASSPKISTLTKTAGIVSSIKGKNNGDMDISTLLKQASTVTQGLNGSGAYTTNGAIKVPQNQAGSGIFSTLVNSASGLLGKLPGMQVQTPVAASVGGSIPLASSGGVVVSLPPLNKGGVSVKTTDSRSVHVEDEGIPWPLIILSVAAYFLLKSFKIIK